MDPVDFALAVLVSLGLIAVLGALPARLLGLRGLWLAAMAPVTACAVVGASGAIAGLLRADYSIGWALAVAAAVSIAAALVGRRRGAEPFRVVSAPTRAGVLTAASIIAAIVLIGVMAFGRPGGVEGFSQTYDGIFHLNAAAFIVATGDASSFTLYSMTNPGDGIEFYPAVWHTLTALVATLSGASIPVAMNAVWATVIPFTWVTGVVLLTDVVLGTRGAPAARRVTAAVLSTASASFPLLLLEWGTIYPTGLAYSLLPAGLALIAAVASGRSDPLRAQGFGVFTFAACLALWGLAVSLSHPRSLFSFAVLVAPLLATWGWAGANRAWKGGGRSRRRLIVGLTTGVLSVAAVAAFGIAYVYRTYNLAARPISDHLNGGPATARQSFGESMLQALLHAPVTGTTGGGSGPSVLLAALVALGCIVAIRRRSTGWLIGSFLLVVLLYALAAGSNSDLAKLATGLWYKDKNRLISLIPIVAVPLATVAVLWIGTRWRRLTRAGRRVELGVLAVAGIALLFVAPALGDVREGIRRTFDIPTDGTDQLLTRGEVDLLDSLPDDVPDGALIAGNPWNGSALTWAIGDRRPLFPALTGAWSADALTIAGGLDRAGADPAVCEAVSRLGVAYFIDSGRRLWSDPAADLYGGVDRAAAAEVGEPVASGGGMTLYKITACGPIASATL